MKQARRPRAPRSPIGGYTLVELVVTVAVFALAFLAIAAIFIGFTVAQSRAAIAQRLLNDGNYLLELVAREVRMHAIDYSCAATDLATNRKYLCLKASDGRSVHIQYDDATPGQEKLKICKTYSATPCTTAAEWVELNIPAKLMISAFAFHTYPTVNPLASDVSADKLFHPLTTIRMTLQGGRGRAAQTYDLQTAVSSRVYNF